MSLRSQLFSWRVISALVLALIGATGADAATLTLAWDPPSGTTTTGYFVWFGKTPGNYTTRVNTGFVLTYAVDGLAAATTYCFAVQAYDRNGAKSTLSGEVCGRTPDATSAPPDDNPSPDDGAPDTETPPDETPTTGGSVDDVVLYASKAAVIKGNWAPVASTGAASGRSMRSFDRGWSTPDAPLPSPGNYFETSFTASANTSYRIWLRLRASGNSKWNDAVWVQFSDSLSGGRAKYRIGTTSALLVNLEPCDRCGVSGWGWQNKGYWLMQPTTVTFANSGTHTIRVQTREDGVEVDQILLSPSKYFSTAPGEPKGDTTILTESVVDRPSTMSEIVMHASDARVWRGNWARSVSAGAAGGQSMRSADRGWSSPDRPFAAPENYFDLTFDAEANTPYRIWVRLRAGGNSKWNDAVWLQFSNALVSGSPTYRMGTTEALLVNLERCNNCGVAGWGWQNGAYWLAQNAMVTFASSGTQTLRVQTREDGVEIDQVVLSALKYKSSAPGARLNDTTLLAQTVTSSAASPTPYGGVPIAVPGTIDASHFDQGGAGIAYADTTSGNIGGAFRATDVDLQGSSLGGHNISWTAAGEWVRFTVNVQTAATYLASFRVASVGGGALQIAAGSPSSGARDLAVPDTRGGQSWATVSVPITLAAGTQILTVRFLTANVNLRSITLRQ